MPLTKRHPTQRLIDLVGALGGSWHGYTAMCRCPAHADATPSLSLRQGDYGILVTCFAGCERHDVIRELGRIRPTRSFLPPAEVKWIGTSRVERLWQTAEPAGVGLASRYLRKRHFPRVPFDIRFHPRCPHGPSPRTCFKPAILVAVREQRRLVAVQRIFLDPVTAEYTEKANLGALGQGAWQGSGAGPTLAIGEGFETAEAFSVVTALPCWASLGARRLDRLEIPSSVSKLIIAEDNDAEGRRAAALASARYARPGLEVCRMPPPAQFNDWAEVLDAHVKRGGGSRE